MSLFNRFTRWMDDTGVGFLVVMILTALVFGVSIGAAFSTCQAYGLERATGIQTKVVMLDCYAKPDDRWVPCDFVFGTAIDVRAEK